MSLFSLVFFVAVFLCLCAIATVLDSMFGAKSVYMAVSAVLFLVTVAFFWLRHSRRGMFPNCANANCAANTYEGVPFRMGDDGFTFICRCGRKYRLKKDQFLILDEHGHEVPYKVKRHFYSQWADA